MDSTHNRRDYSAMWLASCHYQLGDEKQAQKISPYYYKLSPIDRRLTIQSDSLSALADKAFEHQDYTKALKLYKQCDAIEATILGKNHIWRMTTIAKLTNWLRISMIPSITTPPYTASLSVTSVNHKKTTAMSKASILKMQKYLYAN